MRKRYNKRVRVGSPEWWAARTRVDSKTGCVLWTGFVCPYGYARTRWKGKDGVLVHRVAYEQAYGEFDPSLKVCHRCDTPHCCNPKHLFLGTQKDNLRDMFAKGRARPRGKATVPLTDFPTVSGRVDQTLSKSRIREQWLRRWHSTSYPPCRYDGAMAGSWHRDTQAPEQQQIRAILLGERPQSETLQPSPERLLNDATVASSCHPLGAGVPSRGSRPGAGT